MEYLNQSKNLISVIVPIYCVEKYIAVCLESIQKQTLKEIEIILVNDGSPDKSGKIAEEFAKKDDRIKVIHKNNGGLSSARNEGLLIAKGEYVSFVDSDDWIEPTMFEDMYLAAKNNNADVVVSGVIVDYTKESRSVIDNVEKNIFSNNNNEFGNVFWKLRKAKLSNYAWNKLYKRSFLTTNEFTFILDAMPAEDLFFNLSVFKKANSLAVLNKAYYHYLRRDETSLLSNYQKNLIVVEGKRKIAYLEFLNHFKMYGNEYSDFLSRLTIDACIGIVINLYKKKSPFNRNERLKIIEETVFNNNKIKILISEYRIENLYQKIFVVLYKYTNPFLMELGYSLLFYMRRSFINLYLKFRKKQLNK